MNTLEKSPYREMLREYPDVLNVKQVGEVLGVSSKTIYKLINNGSIDSLKIGREYPVAKIILLRYIKAIGDVPQLIAV